MFEEQREPGRNRNEMRICFFSACVMILQIWSVCAACVIVSNQTDNFQAEDFSAPTQDKLSPLHDLTKKGCPICSACLKKTKMKPQSNKR